MGQFPMSDVCSDYALALSHNGPVRSTAMLKNDAQTLPLASSKLKVAVIGPNANLSKSDVSYYGPHTPCGSNFWTMVDAFSQYADPQSEVVTTLGVPNVL